VNPCPGRRRRLISHPAPPLNSESLSRGGPNTTRIGPINFHWHGKFPPQLDPGISIDTENFHHNWTPEFPLTRKISAAGRPPPGLTAPLVLQPPWSYGPLGLTAPLVLRPPWSYSPLGLTAPWGSYSPLGLTALPLGMPPPRGRGRGGPPPHP
jgi:hypothetical protein